MDRFDGDIINETKGYFEETVPEQAAQNAQTRQCCIFGVESHKRIFRNRSGISLRHMRPWLFLAPSLGDSHICTHTLCKCGGPLFRCTGGGRAVCGHGEFHTVFQQPGIPLAVKNNSAFVFCVHSCADGLSLWIAIPGDRGCGQPSLYKTT